MDVRIDLLLYLAAESLDWLLFAMTLGYFGHRPHRHGVDWGGAGLSARSVSLLIPLASQVRVAQELRRLRRSAFVMPAQAGFVVACDEEALSDDMPTVDRIAQLYALAFNLPILAAGCDADAFFFRLVEGDKVTATYASNALSCRLQPSDDEKIAAVVTKCKTAARQICVAVDKSVAIPYAHDVLLQPERFTSPVKQHAALVEVLGLPTWSVGAKFNSLEDGILPSGLNADDVVRVG